MAFVKPHHKDLRNEHDFSIARRRMVEEQLMARDITDPRVLQVMGKVPRHFFVNQALWDQAYSDNPLGIGCGQTISQPYMVALMTQSLNLCGNEKVLEIGTGCGYQSSILAELVGFVYTIERVRTLAFLARRVLRELRYRNIVLRVGDGSSGWPEAQPFNGILVAAGSPVVPYPLVDQLAEGGRLVVPVGGEDDQLLIRMTKKGGKVKEENLGACRFVKLVGEFGWKGQRVAGGGFKKRSLV